MIASVPSTGRSLNPWGPIGAVILTLAIDRLGLQNNPAFLGAHLRRCFVGWARPTGPLGSALAGVGYPFPSGPNLVSFALS
jgi:hypothetical protein